MKSSTGQKDSSFLPLYSNEILDVLQNVVIRGFKSLAAVVHENTSAVEPSDFALLTAILQSILKVPGVELLYSQINLHVANNEMGRYITSLFSWSDQLLIDDDPIYGEHSILFLLELSSVPQIAETLAVEGVLSQLTSANIMQLYTRPKGMGSFDKPPRLHSIWSRGILPLCLNLLDAVQAPVAAEVVTFLNQYPNQLNRNVLELANRRGRIGPRPGDSHITLNTAAETHSLALLSLVVDRYRILGPATGTIVSEIPILNWDSQGVREDLEEWLSGGVGLRDRILPANERDGELMQKKPLDPNSGYDNRLEERVFAELRGALDCLNAPRDF
jgi:nuclear pore complex protein Nup188